MDPFKVLIVDDSAFNRRVISEILSQIEGVQIIGKAVDGEEALSIALTQSPDLITLDLEMPKMNGFSFLRVLMSKRPTPVIVISGKSAKEDVFRALELGALDFVAKPGGGSLAELNSIRNELIAKVALIKQMRGRLWGLLNRPKPKVFLRRSSEIRGPLAPSLPRRLVLIGASMGGPAAIVRLFEHLEADLPISVLVAQHMPERFTKSFAERLGRLGGLQVEEACGRKPIVSGTAWICPGGQNMEVKLHGKELFLEVVPPSLEERYVPSVDRLFHSAAEAYGSRVVGVVLTGMGDDGKKGAESIKRAGGLILCESEETAVAYGMPSNVVQAGLADEVLPIHELAVRLARLARSS